MSRKIFPTLFISEGKCNRIRIYENDEKEKELGIL